MKIWSTSIAVLFLVAPFALIGTACSGDDDDDAPSGGGGTCKCEWGDSCEEYSSGCNLIECDSNGTDVKSSGTCSTDGAIGRCTCASENLVTYYYSGSTDPEGECEFWCDDGVYQAL